MKIQELEYLIFLRQNQIGKDLKKFLLLIFVICFCFFFFPYYEKKRFEVEIKNNSFSLFLPEEEISLFLDSSLFIHGYKIIFEVESIEARKLELQGLFYDKVNIKIKKPKRYQKKKTIQIVASFKTTIGKYIYKTMKGWFI